MIETDFCFHNLEWPPAGARLSGPIVWLRGWVVGKPGHDWIDVRVRHAGAIHLGVLGLPRSDLAAHFKSDKPWLPAEYILGIPVDNGAHHFVIEVMDAHGNWRELHQLDLTMADDGTPPPRVEGRLETSPDGTWTVRDTHHPFQGHLDRPGPTPLCHHGQIPVFGWLLDESKLLHTVLATTDTLVFNHLEHSKTDDALAIKFPEFPGARHARLKGTVDYPATLIEPSCLRVYTTSEEGDVTLCFAQRIHATLPPVPTPADANSYPPVVTRPLAKLPSGRPRRVLFVLRALLPDDACLRALDLATYLIAEHQWAVRVVAVEDGPMRHAFLKHEIESLIVDPSDLFSAPDEVAAQNAMTNLAYQIRWDHLNAVAVFDPLCGWALQLAQKRGIPTLFDCGHDEPMRPDQTAIPFVQELLRSSWQSASAVCFASQSAARAQHALLAEVAAEIVPWWHSLNLPVARSADSGALIAMAPLRTADWLRRHHPEVASRWQFRQGPAQTTVDEKLYRLDEAFNLPVLQRTADWSVRDLTLCLGPLFGRGPLRPVLDALACDIPTVTSRLPTTEEWLDATRLPLIDESNPLALAHALLSRDTRADYLQNETLVAGELIRSRHSPTRLLPQWEALLASVVAAVR